ncbi:MAG: DUF268 domain-containing protein [Bacteroidetes bacterium]|nr:DUF268 domain-containing protein [Bacteroidota bacterium]
MNFKIGSFYPCLGEISLKSGSVAGHYFLQDLFVASQIYGKNPRVHFDVGSRVDGFVAHVASFREIFVIDIRPLNNSINNISFRKGDLMGQLPKNLVNSCDSLSCLHALEHFGLGRYGDNIRWDGHVLGLNNLYKMLKVGGHLYLSVPIGTQRIEFNAHRVFSMKYILELIENKYILEDFSFIDDAGVLKQSVILENTNIINNLGCTFGCGIFTLKKS